MQPPHAPSRRGAPAIAMVAWAALTLAACKGDAPGPTPTPPPANAYDVATLQIGQEVLGGHAERMTCQERFDAAKKFADSSKAGLDKAVGELRQAQAHFARATELFKRELRLAEPRRRLTEPKREPRAADAPRRGLSAGFGASFGRAPRANAEAPARPLPQPPRQPAFVVTHDGKLRPISRDAPVSPLAEHGRPPTPVGQEHGPLPSTPKSPLSQ